MPGLYHKQEFTPLLPKGFHPLTLDDLRNLCVGGFPETSCRAEIMAGFEIIYERFETLEVTGEIWVDGSFLTRKGDPDDIDFVALIPASFYDSGTNAQKEFIDWLISNEDDPKRSFRCHTDVGLIYQPDSPFYYLTIETLRHWEQDVYGFSATTREAKGIPVVQLPISPVIISEEPDVAQEEEAS